MAIKKLRIKIDGKVFEAEVEEIFGEGGPLPAEQTKNLAPAPRAPLHSPSASNPIAAPMPGKVIKINIEKGQQIKHGDVVLVIEAMKMEQEIKSSMEGAVVDIRVSEGDMVKKDQALIIVAQ